MSKITNLEGLYVEELRDLMSANTQMVAALKRIAPQATHPKLRAMLEGSTKGITKHTELLKGLVAAQGGDTANEHCKGMEGLVTEALKHTIHDAPEKGAVLDAAIIAQYQRMTHYGITGFGTVAAFARALDVDGDSERLEAAVKDMHVSDDLMSELAEAAVNVKAAG